MWHVALTGIRTYELPVGTCLTMIEEHYNPRCQPPWSEGEVYHKLEDARDKGTWRTGCPPEDWASFEALWTPAALRDVPVVAEPGEDLFNPTNAVAASECRKVAIANIVQSFVNGPVWRDVWRFDTFRKKVVAVNPPMRLDAEDINQGLTATDTTALRIWLQSQGVTLGKEDVMDSIMMAAKGREFHPVKEYLATCERTRPGILDDLATRVLGAEEEISNLFLKLTLISAVRRIRSPGCQVDTILTLQGGQGAGKTNFVRVLFGEWTRSQMPDLGSKDASAALNGYWGIELSEMDRIARAETSTIKDFLSRTYDDYRPPYGRADVRFPRQSILIATTNDLDILKDASGNRRYWPIPIPGRVNLEYLRRNRDAIWAEAAYLEALGVQHWLEEELEEKAIEARKPFEQEDPWHEAIGDFLRGKEWVTSLEVYTVAVARGSADLLARMTRKELLRTTETLRRLNCEPCKGPRPDRVKGWKIPKALASCQPSKEEVVRLKQLSMAKN